MQGERVLDMSAAPGGKSTYIAQLMRNTGVVIANDLRPQVSEQCVYTTHRSCCAVSGPTAPAVGFGTRQRRFCDDARHMRPARGI